MFVSSSFGAVACVGLMLVNSIAQAAPPSHKPKWKSIEYSTVTGFFAQDLPETDPATFDYVGGWLLYPIC